MKQIHVFAFMGLLLQFNTTVAANEPTHCKSGEQTYFNCTSGSDVASLCGRDDKVGTYVQYRVGKAGKSPELLVPSDVGDPAMGRTFYYTSVENQQHMFTKNEVWFRRGEKHYSVTYIGKIDGEGRVNPGESVVQMWDGPPAGAPDVIRCKKANAGSRLWGAEEVIKQIAQPDHPWSVSPFGVCVDC